MRLVIFQTPSGSTTESVAINPRYILKVRPPRHSYQYVRLSFMGSDHVIDVIGTFEDVLAALVAP